MEETLRRIKVDPVLFSETFLGFKPFPYQQIILRDKSKRICCAMGRQTGKSTTIAAKAAWFAVSYPQTTTIIVSATLRQSMLFFDKLLGFIHSSPYVKASVAYQTRTRLRFKNNSWIIALPCGRSGYSLRGHTADLVILDEAAFIPEDVIANVVFPMVSTRDGAVYLLSTPFDRNHLFYRAFTNSQEWSVYHLPSSVNPLIKPGFLKEQEELIGRDRFAQEYLAQFVDDANSYFPMTLIRPSLDECPEQAEGEVTAGYDPGGKHSQAAFVMVTGAGDLLRVCFIRAAFDVPYTQFNVEIADLAEQYSFTKLVVDQTGLGNPIVEHLRELNLPVEGLTLTQRIKEEIFSNLKILLEQKKIVLPHNLELINALNAIEFERTRTGGYSFSKRQGTYDDLAYALALACWGARKQGGGVVVPV